MTGPRLKFRQQALFLDSPAVVAAIDKTERAPLMKMGAFVRSDAVRSMRPARRKKEDELTDDERKRWEAIQRARRAQGRPLGKPPFYVASRPGEPPRTRRGDIKKFLYFVWDPSSRSVVVGPMGFAGSHVPETLEHGGAVSTPDGPKSIEPRPVMFPALQKNAPQFPELFANALR